MIDMVPKAISLTLVNHSKENLQRELLQELYKPDVLEDLLKESELVVARRKEVVGMVQALNKAEEYVSFSVWISHQFNASCFSGLWRVSEGGLPITFVVHVFVLSTYFYFTPCLTASTLIIPELDLDIFFPLPLVAQGISQEIVAVALAFFSAALSALLLALYLCSRI